MSFRSVDEWEQLSFADCRVTRFSVGEDALLLELEALIIRADNSQNTHYTDSYAGTVQLELTGGSLLSGYREGSRYYDADGALLSETPDKELSVKELLGLTKTAFAGAYLFAVTPVREEGGRQIRALGLEIPDEDPGAIMESYQVFVNFEHAVFTWERFANRAER